MEGAAAFYRYLLTGLRKIGPASRSDLIRLGLICLLAVGALYLFSGADEDSKPEKAWLHIGTELFGAVVVFVLLERNIERVAKLSRSQTQEVGRFPVQQFIDEIRGAKVVRIQDFSLLTLMGEIEPQHRGKFLSALLEAIQIDDVTIEILIARPNSVEAKTRAKTLTTFFGSEQNTFDSLAASVNKLLNFLDQSLVDPARASLLSRIHLHFLDGHPSFSFYQVGDWAYVAFYSERGPNLSENQLRIPITSDAGKFFQRTFNAQFQSANYQWTNADVAGWIADLRTYLRPPFNRGSSGTVVPEIN